VPKHTADCVVCCVHISLPAGCLDEMDDNNIVCYKMCQNSWAVVHSCTGCVCLLTTQQQVGEDFTAESVCVCLCVVCGVSCVVCRVWCVVQLLGTTA